MKNTRDLRLGAAAALILWASIAGASPAAAGSSGPEIQPAGILSPADILAGIRHFGLDPEGQVVLQGPYYVLHAFDGTGTELRVVADAYFGDILFIAPAFNAATTPPYIRAAHIIQVPQPGENQK